MLATLSPAGPDALLPPRAPGEAYALDSERLGGRAPLGPADDAWLALAHTARRAATLRRAERAAVIAAGARCLDALLPDDPAAHVALGAAAVALRTLAGCLDLTRDGHASPAVVRASLDAVQALQGAVAQQEEAGAFLLAFGVLGDLRRALRPVLDFRGDGLLLAQQARVARQLGALTAAEDLYAAAARRARRGGAADLAARALIGAGVLATMRGNYPKARTRFRRGLVAAARGGHDEHRRAAHQGLLAAALAARDAETALAHGWAAFRQTPADAADARAEMLVNLGEVSLRAGEDRAALGAALTALELTALARIRLPALGTAAGAAARLGIRWLFDSLAAQFEQAVERSGLPFENARTVVEFAEAAAAFGHPSAAAFAARAADLATRARFHEVVARAEHVQADLAMRAAGEAARTADTTAARPFVSSPDRPASLTEWPLGTARQRAVWSPRARSAIRSMERLAAGALA